VLLARDLSAPHISTGDMLREAVREGRPLGLKAKEFMDRGALVPDEVVIGLVEERLRKDDAKTGFILDGFPRTVDQAESLDRCLEALKMPLDHVIYFKTTLAMVIRRLSGRRVCGQCGKTYHMTNFRPKKEGVCDACQGSLVQRPDDHEDAIENRLRVYEKQTAPLIEYYGKRKVLAEVDGDLDVDPLRVILKDLFSRKQGQPVRR
jgi:adenylate kinase